jgi:CheY-like chemotaxis protein
LKQLASSWLLTFGNDFKLASPRGSRWPPHPVPCPSGGWEATRRLKGNPQTRDIPIIALSAHALAGEREKALAAGCNEFDSKPIEFDRLVATMRRVLAHRK